METMENSSKKVSIKDNNRGASLLIVLGMFVMLTAVAANMLMLVNAGNDTANTEYNTQQGELCISSIYAVLNDKMQEGFWEEAFVQDETIIITVDGFQDISGEAIPVTIDVTLNRNLADVAYHITYRGETYQVPAKYTYYNIDGGVTIALKTCEEMIHE